MISPRGIFVKEIRFHNKVQLSEGRIFFFGCGKQIAELIPVLPRSALPKSRMQSEQSFGGKNARAAFFMSSSLHTAEEGPSDTTATYRMGFL